MELRQKIREMRSSKSLFWRLSFFLKDRLLSICVKTVNIIRTEKAYLNEKKELTKKMALYQKRPLSEIPRFREFHLNSAVLKTRQEYIDAINEVESLGLIPYRWVKQKAWDSLAALSAILRYTDKDALILDAGATLSSRILPWLAAYGYKNLTGINLDLKREIRMGHVIYKYGDLTRTGYKNGVFDAITCISVIEHGVNIEAYMREMSRILKPGGLLITSADYWPTPIDTTAIRLFGSSWQILDRKGILDITDIAKKYGLRSNSNIELGAKDKAIVGLEREFTFIYFVLVKNKAGSDR